MNKIKAITIGDINGIGIEILLKTWKQNKINNFILFTNIKEIKKYLNKKKIKVELNILEKTGTKINYKKNKINIFSYNVKSPEENTFKSLEYAYNFCKNNICTGIITLPLRKELIKKKINNKFIGHTEYFQKLDRKKFANMILFHKKVIISPLTTHIEISKISKIISNKEFLYNQIFNLYKCLKIDFSYNNPRFIISGVNPHAGENGELGIEERKKNIIPILKKLKNNGINIEGPFSADSMLIKKFKKI